MSERYLILKWGSIKGWKNLSDEQAKILQKYMNMGKNMSAMAHRDTPEQKDLIIKLINTMEDGELYNDWSGETYTKQEALDYINNYGRNRDKVVVKALKEVDG